MKRIFGCFILVTVIVFTTAGYLGLTVQGQEESAQTQLSKRIIYILNATAVEAKKWDDKPIAIRTHAQITDIVWNTNPDDAVEYLKAAWTATGGVTDPKRERSAVVNPSLRNSLRRDVLLVARKRAPELAARWLEEMVAESKAGERPERGAFDDRTARSTVLLQMANELVRENPQAATELLIESLRDGVSFSFQNVLVQLHQRDSGLADNVFRAALARLKSLGMSDPNELLILYAYLFTPNRVLGANTSDSRNQLQVAVGRSPVPVPPGRQNPLIAVEFLDLASDLLLFAPLPERGDSQNVARALVSTIGILSGEVSEKLPQKAALL